MGNSLVYRIHAGDDLDAAYAIARRLSGHTFTDCSCPQDVSADADTHTHALDRYLPVREMSVFLSMPADLLDEIPRTSIRHGDQQPQKDGTVSLLIDVNPTIVAAFARLPVIDAEASTPYRPLPNTVADDFLAAARADPAVISWHICWRGEHHQTGFELAINGITLWHPEAPPGHSIYVHVPPTRPHLADDLATAVGGRIQGEPAIGW